MCFRWEWSLPDVFLGPALPSLSSGRSGFAVPLSSVLSGAAKPGSEPAGVLHILDLEGGGFSSAYSPFSG